MWEVFDSLASILVNIFPYSLASSQIMKSTQIINFIKRTVRLGLLAAWSELVAVSRPMGLLAGWSELVAVSGPTGQLAAWSELVMVVSVL